MVRKHIKCSACRDLLWFEDRNMAPQSVVCKCGTTILKETGAEGRFEAPTNEDIKFMEAEELKGL